MPPRQQAPPQEERGWFYYARMAGLIYLGSNIMNTLVNQVVGPKVTAPAPAAVYDPSSPAAAGSPERATPALDAYNRVRGSQGIAVPMWPEGASIDMYLYFSTSEEGAVDFEAEPAVLWRGLDYKPKAKIDLVQDLELEIPESVRHNGSYWADIFLTNGHGSPNPADASYNGADVYHLRKLLTRFHKKKIIRKEVNLLSGGKDEPAEEKPTAAELEKERKETPIVAHWHQNLTLALLTQRPEINLGGTPAEVREFISLEPSGRKSLDGKSFHYPILYPNDFWNLRSQYIEINETTTTLPIRIQLHDISHWKFQLYASAGASLEKQAIAAGGSGGEMDEIKRTLIETNPWLLGTTVIVSVLHMLFEFLAFSSDVGHWRKKDGDLTGVSIRTILSNVVVQLIIMLYLLDSSDETSYMILMGQGVGLAIECWKITKIGDFKLAPAAPGSIIPYRVSFEDKKELSASEKLTQEYDALAFRLVSYVAGPVLLGYSIYSLVYSTHRSWYSFTVNTLAQATYSFGFVQLIPALIINYKLKSVAHMPMKAMVYKTLSTVVDDFFAFIIKQPWLHRLACFRDDAVFLVLLYQRWIYRVDKTRVNEYGQGFVDPAILDSSEGVDGEPVGVIAAAAVVGEKETKKDK